MEINYKSLAYKIFCWGFFILCALLFFRYLFPYLFPFIISWVIGYAVYPVAIKLSKRTKISRRICSFALVSFLLILILSIIFLVCNRLIYEIQNLFDYLTDNSDKIAKYIEDAVAFFDNVVDDLPFLSGLQNSELAESIRKNINSLIGNVWESFLDGIGSALPDLAGSIVTALPNILLVSLMVTIASFYFAIDIDSVNRKLKELLPQKWGSLLKSAKSRAIDGVVRYLKSYFVIFSITFIELFVVREKPERYGYNFVGYTTSEDSRYCNVYNAEMIPFTCQKTTSHTIYAVWDPVAGDLNSDYLLSAPDLVSLRQIILKEETDNSEADTNLDGVINVIDLIRLKRYIAANP